MNLAGMKELTIDGVKLKELSIDGVLTWRAGLLPAGYTPLKSIRSNPDVGSWLDTLVNPYDYDDKILEYIFRGCATTYKVTNGNNYVFGCLAGGRRSGNVALRGLTSAGTCVYLGGNSNVIYQSSAMPSAGTDFEVNLRANSNDVNSVVGDVNGAKFTRSAPTFAASQMPNDTIYLGHCNGTTAGASKPFIGDIYYYYNGIAGGIAIREMLPCIDPYNIVGMYDLVTNAFFTNTSDSAPFTAGEMLL